MSHTSPAPQHRLADLRDWLMDRIDGSEETRGEDGLISGFIAEIDALPSEKGEPRGCPTPGACSCPSARPAATPRADRNSFFSETHQMWMCPRDFARSLERELNDIKQRLLPQFQGRAQMAEHERDGMHEKLIAATNHALEVAAKVADEMTRNVAGGSNVGKAIRNLKESK